MNRDMRSWLSKDNGLVSILLCMREQTIRIAGYPSNVSHLPDKRLRLMHPIRNAKHRASTSFDFYIVCAILIWLSYIGRRADALALRADERRDKLRKAAVSCK